MNQSSSRSPWTLLWQGGLAVTSLIVLAAMVWQGITASGNPDPQAVGISHGAAILNTGLLVFREGLEAILVLAALTASFKGSNASYRRPVAAGAGLALLASMATWFIVIAVLKVVSAMTNASTLDIQAGTGLLAIVVLLVVMNWFLHNVYWTGWIAMHNNRKRNLMDAAGKSQSQILLGLAVLGFSAVYREGFEIVLFLQDLRLSAGSGVVLEGVAVGLAFTAVVGTLTFVAHQKLPYKKMLILTGLMLACVLIVMVGENIQEMQLAHWISTTDVKLPIPDWMGLWFAVFPNWEGLISQLLAAVFVIGSYFVAQYLKVWRPLKQGQTPAQRADSAPVTANNVGKSGRRQTSLML